MKSLLKSREFTRENWFSYVPTKQHLKKQKAIQHNAEENHAVSVCFMELLIVCSEKCPLNSVRTLHRGTVLQVCPLKQQQYTLGKHKNHNLLFTHIFNFFIFFFLYCFAISRCKVCHSLLWCKIVKLQKKKFHLPTLSKALAFSLRYLASNHMEQYQQEVLGQLEFTCY